MRQAKQKGFTLIELLVVIAIIGILSTLAVVALNSARQKSRDAKRVADIKQMQTALELWFNDAHGYPTVAGPILLGDVDPTPLTIDCAGGTTCTALCTGGFKDVCDSADTVYMGIVPKAPMPFDGSCDAAENSYTYQSTGVAAGSGSAGYTIDFCLGAAVGSLAADVHTASPDGIN